MSEGSLKTLAVLMGGLFLLALILLMRPGYLASPEMLLVIIIAQAVVAALCRYRQVFFLALITAFLWAGMDLPLQRPWLQGRWFVLAVGALAGLAIYMKDRNHRFRTFHLIALFCMLAAIVSAIVSAYPEESFLKAVSLVLLFLYCCSGARIAVPAMNPEKFFRGLKLGCEILTWITAFSYFLLRQEIFGSPNSLGAVMGVVVVPMVLWGFLTAQTVMARRRLAVGLLLGIMVLMSSFARAGIAAGALSCVAICFSLRQYRLVIKGFAVAFVLGLVVAMFVPLPNEAPKWNGSESIAEMFIFKGKPQQGFMGSRIGPWQQTWEVIKDHPWFGSGFGTSLTGTDLDTLPMIGSHVESRLIREHGNSYLAIAEWVGLLGVVPFYFLIALTVLNIRRVFTWMRRTGDVFSPAVPAAAILLAGLIDAGFEDWLFAIGYYLSVFFWAIAFILVDVMPAPALTYSRETVLYVPDPQYMAVASGQ